ncbi:hypothetical protein [Aliikangiella sp. IMCC44632]
MNSIINKYLILFASLVLAQNLFAVEKVIDWNSNSQAFILPKQSKSVANDYKLEPFNGVLKAHQEVIFDLESADFISIKTLKHNKCESPQNRSSLSHLQLYTSKGDGLFVKVETNTVLQEQWSNQELLFNTKSKQTKQVLVINQSNLRLCFKLFAGKYRASFNQFEHSDHYLSEHYPKVEVTHEYKTARDYNVVKELEYKEILEGPALYRFELIYPWKNEYGSNEVVQINTFVNVQNLKEHFFTIQPSRFSKTSVGSKHTVVSRIQNLDLWVPKGKHEVSLSPDRHLLLRRVNFKEEDQLFYSANYATSKVQQILKHAFTKNDAQQNDWDLFKQDQFAYRQMFPKEAVRSATLDPVTIQTLANNKTQYVSVNRLKANEVKIFGDADLNSSQTRLISLEANSSLNYNSVLDSPSRSVRLKLKPTINRQVFELKSNIGESYELLYDPNLIKFLEVAPSYNDLAKQESITNFNAPNDFLVEQILDFSTPWKTLSISNMGEASLMHQLAYSFVKPLETSDTAFAEQFSRLISYKNNGEIIAQDYLYDRLSSSHQLAYKNMLSRVFEQELSQWQFRLDRRQQDFSNRYQIEARPISVTKTMQHYQKLVDGLKELGIQNIPTASKVKDIESVFALFSSNMLKKGYHQLLRQTLFYFTQSQDKHFQTVAERFYLSILYQMKRWHEIEGYWANRMLKKDSRSFIGIASSWFKQGRMKQAARLFALSQLTKLEVYPEMLIALAQSEQDKLTAVVLEQTSLKLQEVPNFATRKNSQSTSGALKSHTENNAYVMFDQSISYQKTFNPSFNSKNKVSLLYNQALDLYLQSINLSESTPLTLSMSGKKILKFNFFAAIDPSSDTSLENGVINISKGNETFAVKVLENRQVSNIIYTDGESNKLLVNQSFWIEIPHGSSELKLSIQGASGEILINEYVTTSALDITTLKTNDAALNQAIGHSIMSINKDIQLRRYFSDRALSELKIKSFPYNNNFSFMNREHTSTEFVNELDLVSQEEKKIRLSNPYSGASVSNENSLQESYFQQNSYQQNVANRFKDFLYQFQDSNLVSSINSNLGSDFNKEAFIKEASIKEEFIKDRQAYRVLEELLQSESNNLALANKLKLFLNKGELSAEITQPVKNILTQYEWVDIDSIVSSAGKFSVKMHNLQGFSELVRLKYALKRSVHNSNEIALYANKQRVIDIHSEGKSNLRLKISALSTLGEPNKEVHINLSINRNRYTKTFNSDKSLTHDIKLKAGVNRIVISVDDNANRPIFFTLNHVGSAGRLLNPVLADQKTQFHAATGDFPLRVYIAQPSWVRVIKFSDSSLNVVEQYVDKAGIVEFESVDNDKTGYKIQVLKPRKDKSYQANLRSALFSSKTSIENEAFTGEAKDYGIDYQSTFNFSIDTLTFGTHTFALGSSTNTINDDDPIQQNVTKSSVRYQYRKYFPSINSYFNNKLDFKHTNSFNTVVNKSHLDLLENKNLNYEFDFNLYYQLNSDNLSAKNEFRVNSAARVNWNYYWNNQFQNKLFTKLDLNYLSYNGNNTIADDFIDNDVYSSYKSNHLNSITLGNQFKYQPYLDTIAFVDARVKSNQLTSSLSLDNYSVAFGVRQFINNFRVSARYRHKAYLTDSIRAQAFELSQFRFQMDYDYWSKNSHLWQLSLAYQYSLEEKNSEIMLWLSWSPTKYQYLNDYSPIDETFLKLRKSFVGDYRVNNYIIEDSHE